MNRRKFVLNIKNRAKHLNGRNRERKEDLAQLFFCKSEKRCK